MDDLFEEVDRLLSGLENKIDQAIGILSNADLDNPFGRLAIKSDRDIARLKAILYELKSKRDAAVAALTE